MTLIDGKAISEQVKQEIAAAMGGQPFRWPAKTSFIRQIEVDEEQFAKLYLANFAAFFNLLPMLSNTG